jgi:hypothetical protein
VKPIKQQSKIDGACSKITGHLLQRELPHAPNPLGVVARSLFRGFFLMLTKPHLTEIALLAPSVPRILQSRQVAKSFRPSRSNWDYGFFQSHLMPHPRSEYSLATHFSRSSRLQVLPPCRVISSRSNCQRTLSSPDAKLPSVTVAVNSSAIGFVSLGYPLRVVSTLAKWGIDPTQREIEIPESLAISGE